MWGGEIDCLSSTNSAIFDKNQDQHPYATAVVRNAKIMKNARYHIGQIVKHRIYPFRGVVFDVDPVFDNTDEWYDSIPHDVRPKKDQPFYHLFAESEETEYVAYVSEQNLVPDDSGEPVHHPQIDEIFTRDSKGLYHSRDIVHH